MRAGARQQMAALADMPGVPVDTIRAAQDAVLDGENVLDLLDSMLSTGAACQFCGSTHLGEAHHVIVCLDCDRVVVGK